MNKEAKIAEIFESLQGEGVYIGVKQVFVRFFGCDLKCVFCDTPLNDYKTITVSGLCQEILGFKNYHSLCLTGGEPLQQAEFLEKFLKKIENSKIKIYLETNGVLFQELAQVISWIDIVAMDFKLPSTTKKRELWDAHEQFLKIASIKEVFVKMVISSATSDADIEKASDVIRRVKPDCEIILQPNWFELNDALLRRLDYFRGKISKSGFSNVEIMPQAHKLAQVK